MPEDKTKIALVLPNLGGGGAEKVSVNLANYWASQGKEVDFVLMRNEGEFLDLVSPEISIFDLGTKRIRGIIKPLTEYILKNRPTVIIVGMWPLTSMAVLAWLLTGKKGKLYLVEHCILSDEYKRRNKLPEFYLRKIIEITYPLATGLIAVSKGVARDICRLGSIAPHKVQIIHNPAAVGNPPTRATLSERERLWGRGFKYHLLTVGALKHEKNHELLIQAFAKLPEKKIAKLTILGEGNLRPSLEKLIDNLGLQNNVSMPGFSQDVASWYRSSDLFILSSTTEGLPTVLIEALECGTPIVSTECSTGPAEILNDGEYGRIVPVNDLEKLVEAISEALREIPNPNRLNARAAEFTIEVISTKYLNYFGID
jgi:glycosyltransferase involved in cell wall biosynthesis